MSITGNMFGVQSNDSLASQIISGAKYITGDITSTVKYTRDQKENTKRQGIYVAVIIVVIIMVGLVFILKKKS
jgi:t-SNARE complex subunit (syntaxin)